MKYKTYSYFLTVCVCVCVSTEPKAFPSNTMGVFSSHHDHHDPQTSPSGESNGRKKNKKVNKKKKHTTDDIAVHSRQSTPQAGNTYVNDPVAVKWKSEQNVNKGGALSVPPVPQPRTSSYRLL